MRRVFKEHSTPLRRATYDEWWGLFDGLWKCLPAIKLSVKKYRFHVLHCNSCFNAEGILYNTNIKYCNPLCRGIIGRREIPHHTASIVAIFEFPLLHLLHILTLLLQCINKYCINSHWEEKKMWTLKQKKILLLFDISLFSYSSVFFSPLHPKSFYVSFISNA